MRRLGVAEVEAAALELVGARLQRDVGDGAAGAAELGVVVARRDADGLERLGRRNQHGQQAGAVVVVDAFDLHVVGEARLAVDVRRQRVLRVEELRVRPERPRGAGHRGDHALEVAAEAERHRRDLLALDDAAGVGAIRLQRRRVGADRQHFGDGAGFEREVDADGRVDVDADVLAHDLLEAGQLGFDAIDAVLQVRERVEPVLVGDGRRADAGALVGGGDGGTGHGAAARVGDAAEQRAAHGLGVAGDARASTASAQAAAAHTARRAERT